MSSDAETNSNHWQPPSVFRSEMNGISTMSIDANPTFMYGDFDETQHEYLHGSCWTFATALHEATGWPLAWVKDVSKESEWPFPVHGFCVHPSGRYVDASGYCTLETYRHRYGIPQPAVSPATIEDFDAICGLEDDEIAFAAEFLPYLTAAPFPLDLKASE